MWKELFDVPSLRSNVNEAGEIFARFIIRGLFLVIDFQGQLYVPGWLSTCDLPHRGSKAHIGCVELDVIERVDEVGSELQSKLFPDREVFMQTHVYIGVMRRT